MNRKSSYELLKRKTENLPKTSSTLLLDNSSVPTETVHVDGANAYVGGNAIGIEGLCYMNIFGSDLLCEILSNIIFYKLTCRLWR